MNLAGQVAMITGGAVRLGREIALALAHSGCSIVLHYGHSESAAQETAQQISQLQHERKPQNKTNSGNEPGCITVQADFNDHNTSETNTSETNTNGNNAATTLFDAAIAQFGRVDFLINNAAIFEPATLDEITDDHWNRHLAINLKAPVFLAQEFMRRKPPNTRGQIINIADWRAIRPIPGHLAYTLTKSGIVSLTKILAQELGPQIQVNAIAPGAILPPPNATENYLKERAQQTALQRTGQPTDITEAVLFLLKSNFLTGEIIHVTGGEEL